MTTTYTAQEIMDMADNATTATEMLEAIFLLRSLIDSMGQDLDKTEKMCETPPNYVHPDSNAFISWD